jgi:predicted secreted protein
MKDRRSRKVAFLSHCLINQNSKVQGFATFPGMVTPLVKILERHGIGIVQVPCPEERELGIGRPVGDDSKQGYDTPSYRKTCSRIAEETVRRIRDYQENGYRVSCILGVDGSPSCGVSITPVRKGAKTVPSPEKGIFFEALLERMGRERIDIPVIGIPESEEAGSLRDSLKRLEGVLKD